MSIQIPQSTIDTEDAPDAVDVQPPTFPANGTAVPSLDEHPRPRQDAVTLPMETPRAVAEVAGCTPSSLTKTGSNGDENRYKDANGHKTYIGNFHKGLAHNALGEVVPEAYEALVHALQHPTPSNFAAIPLGLGRLLRNPQAGLATDLEGPDPAKQKMRAAPRLDSAEAAGEAVELYWMALLRDVSFTQFDTNPLVAQAATELSTLTDFTGPKVGGQVTPATLFRGCTRGENEGPLLSQFLLVDIPYGSLTISQRQITVQGEAQLGVGNADYMTDPGEWLDIQNGGAYPTDKLDATHRYIRNMRDLGRYVQVDALYEAYLNACLILLGTNAPLDDGNPYHSPHLYTYGQDGFATFGGPHILSLVTEVATRALKVVWYQKWFVHRRLRPEAYGGLLHQTKTGARTYPLHQQALNSQAVQETFNKFGSYLLPMAFPEGSPMHPAYGAGHATVAGACVTILKAWFKEDVPLPFAPQIPSADGTALEPYNGPTLTVEGELNKVAANIGIGRNMAGVHWRSDHSESIKLGEQVALYILRKQSHDYHEKDWSFSLTTFGGVPIQINRSGIKRLDTGKPYKI